MSRGTNVAQRKKPRQARARETVEVILAATARVLANEGHGKATTNRIAQVAGVSVGSLYQYFPNRDALFAALVERHAEEMWTLVETRLRGLAAKPVAAAVREMVVLVMQAHASNPRLHRALNEQVPRVGRLALIHGVEARLIELVRDYLEEHRREVRPRDLDLAAFVAVVAIEALGHAAVVHHPGRARDERLIGETTKLIAGYLCGSGAQRPAAPGTRAASRRHRWR